LEGLEVMKMNLLAFSSLAGHFSGGWAVLAGIVGSLAFLMVVYMGLGTGMTRMNFLYILGSMIVPRAPRRTQYTVGLMAHLMLGAGFGVVHAGLLHAIGITSVGQAAAWDLVIGAVHGAIILVAMPMMLVMAHPLVRGGAIERPGVALTGFGGMTPMGSLMAHAAFGLVTGTIYAAAILH
jgi:hypothetical protein